MKTQRQGSTLKETNKPRTTLRHFQRSVADTDSLHSRLQQKPISLQLEKRSSSGPLQPVPSSFHAGCQRSPRQTSIPPCPDPQPQRLTNNTFTDLRDPGQSFPAVCHTQLKASEVEAAANNIRNAIHDALAKQPRSPLQPRKTDSRLCSPRHSSPARSIHATSSQPSAVIVPDTPPSTQPTQSQPRQPGLESSQPISPQKLSRSPSCSLVLDPDPPAHPPPLATLNRCNPNTAGTAPMQPCPASCPSTAPTTPIASPRTVTPASIARQSDPGSSMPVPENSPQPQPVFPANTAQKDTSSTPPGASPMHTQRLTQAQPRGRGAIAPRCKGRLARRVSIHATAHSTTPGTSPDASPGGIPSVCNSRPCMHCNSELELVTVDFRADLSALPWMHLAPLVATRMTN